MQERRSAGDGSPEPLRATFRALSPNTESWFPLLGPHLGSLFGVLDELDIRLLQTDRHVFVTYDDLDRVSPGDWTTLQTILQGLVQFWAAYGRRYKRLRPKLFLRRDLYERAALFSPDIAKIGSNRVELLWTTSELYGVLFKRILNSGGDLKTFLGSARPEAKPFDDLGLLPIGERRISLRACGRETIRQIHGHRSA